MKNTFVQGDKARLLTGGPVMIIRGQHYDVIMNEYKTEIVDCIWFVKNCFGKEEVCYSPFSVDQLIKIRNV